MVELTIAHLKRMWIPRVHWDARLSEIPDTCLHKDRIRKYLVNIVDNIYLPKGLLLFGKNSSGKSGLASIILKAAAHQGILGFWIVHRRLPQYEVEKIVFEEGVTVIQRARTVPILVIDEMLLRNDIRGTETMLEGLVRERIDEKLCTIITTNLTPTNVKHKYPELGAALLEAVRPLKIEGKDFRMEKQEGLGI